jgi:hypothetical protein
VTTRSETSQVARQAEMTVERAAHQSTALRSGYVLVTGGCAGRGCDPVVRSTELYNPEGGSFQLAAPMHVPRASHVAVHLADGRVLVAGGWTGQNATASAEVYDPSQGIFVRIGDMTTARVGAIATLLADRRVLVTGGETEAGAALSTSDLFDPATDTFSRAARMRSPRASHAAVRLADGRVLVTGGHQHLGEVLRSAEIFDPETGTFQPTGDMTVPRHKHAAALLPDGTVLIIGGSDGAYRHRYVATEIYDPATGQFSRGPDMHWPRYKLPDAVARLPSGAVVVAGGAARPEVYDPVARGFTVMRGTLGGVQEFATATVLPNGEVIVVGGYDAEVRSSASAWLLRLSD